MVDENGVTPTASRRSTGVMFDDILTFETRQSCLQDFIVALEVHLEDSHHWLPVEKHITHKVLLILLSNA